MDLNLSSFSTKKEAFNTIKTFLENLNFKIVNADETRPWGGFYVIDETQSTDFIQFFFNDVPEAKRQTSGKISPKILIVESNKRLSWQYHHRRAEVWKVIGGEVGVVISNNNKEGNEQSKKKNDIIILKKSERHRLVGKEGWGVIAEIWQHTYKDNPSDEEDIVRVQDDFGR